MPYHNLRPSVPLASGLFVSSTQRLATITQYGQLTLRPPTVHTIKLWQLAAGSGNDHVLPAPIGSLVSVGGKGEVVR